jgi:hypothetical protein
MLQVAASHSAVVVFSIFFLYAPDRTERWATFRITALLAHAVAVVAAIASHCLVYRKIKERGDVKDMAIIMRALGASAGVQSTLTTVVACFTTSLLATAAIITIIARPASDRIRSSLWDCLATSIVALNNMSALGPAIALATGNFRDWLRRRNVYETLTRRCISDVARLSLFIADKSFLKMENAALHLKRIKAAKVHVIITDCNEVMATEDMVCRSCLADKDKLPLILRLDVLCASWHQEDHPCRDVYVLFNEAPVAIVSGEGSYVE